MGRTISAYVSAALGERVDVLVREEGAVPAQLAAAALDLYTLLPQEIRRAASAILAGSQEDRQRLVTELARVIAGVQLAIARQRVVDTLKVPGLEAMSDEEVEALAVRESGRGRATQDDDRASSRRRA